MLLLTTSLLGFATKAKPATLKFQRMMDACIIAPAAIEMIDDKQMRTLFRGVSAAAEDEGVRLAFQIVYEDLGPVRVAGDLIFGKLQRVAGDATARSETLTELTDTSDSADMLKTTRALFDVLDDDSSGGLDRQELLDSPELLAELRGSAAGSETDEEVVDRFLAAADSDGDGQVTRPRTARARATPRARLPRTRARRPSHALG